MKKDVFENVRDALSNEFCDQDMDLQGVENECGDNEDLEDDFYTRESEEYWAWFFNERRKELERLDGADLNHPGLW